MKRFRSIALILLLTLLLAGCGRAVDEAILPTRIPTIVLQSVEQPVAAATSVPTATVLPATSTPTDEPPTPTTRPTVEPTATAKPTVALPTTPTITASVELTITPTVSTTRAITASKPTVKSTATAEPTVALTLTPTGATTGVVTVTVAVTTTPAVSSTLKLTATIPPTANIVTTVTTPATGTGTLTVTTPPTATSTQSMVSVLPAGVDSALASADLAHGQLLTQINVCNACHSLDQGVRLVGPSWYNLADTAAKRVAGQSAEVYLYNSITSPNSYVVESYPAGIMLQIYREKLSDQDFADIITYLLTLRAQ